MKQLLAFCLAVLFLCGCAADEKVTPTGEPAGAIGDWVLVDPSSAYTVTLTITRANDELAGHYSLRFAGRSAVNQYVGDGRFSKGPSIESGEVGTGSIYVLGATKMAGPPEAMRFETDYFEQFRAVNRIETTSSGKLHLSYKTTTSGVLIYQRQ